MATTTDVARFARTVGAAGDKGLSGWGFFDLNEIGYCTRFVRQVHEAALGIGPHEWEFRSPDARALEAKLRVAGKLIHETAPVPGDIVCINGGSGRYGHVGIFVGDGEFAENTSSSRGPGTTISEISQVANRITGFYRAVPLANLVSPYAQPAIDWALEEGLLEGRPGEPINGSEPVTLERLMVFLHRFSDKGI